MFALDGMPEVLSAEELHNHVWSLLVVLAEIVDIDYVLVLDVTCHAGFLQEASFCFFIGAPLFGENLDCDSAADNGIPRAIDVRHSPTEEFFQFVLSEANRELARHG